MKLKHLYMLGVVALMTASCNEDRFLDIKQQNNQPCGTLCNQAGNTVLADAL